MSEPARSKPLVVLGIRYAERRKDPPPGLRWHKVQPNVDGATLGSIADRFLVEWTDLALYNFRTTDLTEVNWYLWKFVGCRAHNGRMYVFNGRETPGYILVPDLPPSMLRNKKRIINATRDGTAKSDAKVQVEVIERLPTGAVREISGKWLYVFSGTGGVNFGNTGPPKIPSNDEGVGPNWKAPGSAFKLDFPGVFYLKEKPNRLEYEIVVTPEDPPGADYIKGLTGKSKTPKSKLRFNKSWHFLSDPAILSLAFMQARHERREHVYRPTRWVTIDLSTEKRYYFLLSPVQLGPEALKYALDHPEGLTPLLRPGHNSAQWTNPNGPAPDDPDRYVAPQLADLNSGTLKLEVIDPFAWAVSLANDVFAYELSQYADWVTNAKNTALKGVVKETGWSTDQFLIASMLQQIRDGHKEPESIDKRLRDAAKWKQDLKTWQTKFITRNADIIASAHRAVIEIIEWLDGSAHKIIETALLQDTKTGTMDDIVDVGGGIVHWAICTEHLIALEPGVAYLRGVFARKGTFLWETVLQHIAELDKPAPNISLNADQQAYCRFASGAVVQLCALRDFVSDPPPLSAATKTEYRKKLEQYAGERRARIIAFVNGQDLLPHTLKELKAVTPPPSPMAPLLAAVTMSVIDIGDKSSNLLVVKDNARRLTKFKQNYFKELGKLGEGEFPTVQMRGRWLPWVTNSAKGVVGILQAYNLSQVINTARFDYQHDVTFVDWASSAASITPFVIDVCTLAETFIRGTDLIFPNLVELGKGTLGISAARVVGVAGWTFASINVLAMFISGCLTAYSMSKQGRQAYSRGDYTAAKYYYAGAVGGLMAAGGALVLGYALIKAGAGTASTGVGATVGVVLMVAGGIISAVAAFFASRHTSDDYQVFALKCFLGKEGDKEPRFGSDAPSWSLAKKTKGDSWPIDTQKQALFNLMGRFKLTNKWNENSRTLTLTLTPGLVLAGCTFQTALHYGKTGTKTAATFQWTEFDETAIRQVTGEPIEVIEGKLFDAADSRAFFDYDGNRLSLVKLYSVGLNYDTDKELVGTVSLRYPGMAHNVIRARKLLIDEGDADEDDVVSDLYE